MTRFSRIALVLSLVGLAGCGSTPQEQGVFEAIRAGLALLMSLFWTAFAWLMDVLRTMGPLKAGLTIILCTGFCVGVARVMQWRLNRKLSDKPEEPVNLVLHELMFTLPGLFILLLFSPFLLAAKLVQAGAKAVKSGLEKRKKKAEGDDEQPTKPEQEEESPPAPVLVASIGPTFLFSAVFAAGLYLVGLITEPLLRLQMDLSAGSPAWEIILLGQRPELQWYIPLSRYPWLGAVLTILFWMTIWWWGARIGRWALYQRIGQNLVEQHQDPQTLPWWRIYVGSPELWRIHPTYDTWAKWLPLAAAPFLVIGWFSLSIDPYRLSPSMFSISLVLTVSWAMHLKTQGVARLDEEEETPEEAPPLTQANDWSQVLKDLESRFQIRTPHLFHPPRQVEPIALSNINPEREGIVSMLLTELLPKPQTFTHMQYVVLRTLSLQGYIHTDPPLPRGELELGTQVAAPEDITGARHRNQIILAPEGAGKTTLAMLAACNHAIIHTRSTLIVTRDNQRAQELFQTMRSAIEPSTLRWNIRERRVGADLVNDLSQGIIPDIITCSLHQLVVNVLDEPQNYTPFLQNVGLIIIDDVESFCGSIEVHAQLAFRRLMLRLRTLLGVDQLGEDSAPMLLLLGTDSMHDTPAWARTLCGQDAVSRYFDYNSAEAATRDESMMAFHGLLQGEEEDPGAQQASPAIPAQQAISGLYQLIYRLNDFRNADEEVLRTRDIIESCERLAVPWHYRPCGDQSRHLQRSRLHLRDEPKYYRSSPAQAGVILLQGNYAEVQRELTRLVRAGSAFEPWHQQEQAEEVPLKQDEANASKKSKKQEAEAPALPIAIITIIDRDEEMALTELNHQSTLAEALRTLPRPIVRPPLGQVVQEHMAAELTSQWVEVQDVLDIFGNPSAQTLMKLADAGMLMSDKRTDLHDDVQLYEHKVFVRATNRALGANTRVARRIEGARAPLLPPKVNQVEMPSGNTISIRDRTSLSLVEMADADSAGFVYYLGRIFENAQGRFIVVGRATPEDNNADDTQSIINEDILVEPFLNDGISSPRRRIRIKTMHVETPLTNTTQAPRSAQDLLRIMDEGAHPRVEPVLIGRFPVATHLGEVECHTEHIATCRLGPILNEVRQRIVFEPHVRQRHHSEQMNTTALALYPNPEVDFEYEEAPPQLALEEARLIASAMRAVLPSMYRGASSSLEVAIQIQDDEPGPNHILSAFDGFFFFDPTPGGNGAARALHRDGVELLLRLCRVYIERVLYHDRLRARFDLWGSESEIMTDYATEETPSTPAPSTTGTWFAIDASDLEAWRKQQEETVFRPGTQVRLKDQDVRRRALIWLDSRLRPEGSLSGGRVLGKYGSGNEDGEGDLSDIGRCWYARTGGVTDLLWAKHRWRLDEDGAEAMVDVGFDRDTAAASRFLTPESRALKPWMKIVSEQLQNPAFNLSDNTVWSTARPMWVMSAGQDTPVGTNGELITQQPIKDAHVHLGAIAAHDFKALKPLSQLLLDRARAPLDTVEGRYAIVYYVSRFVQGIPSAPPSMPRANARPPVHTLLHRLGDCDSKSLLLAMMLKHCGLNTGLFINTETHDALCAVAALNSGTTNEGDVERTMNTIEHFREMVGLEHEDMIWGELPSRPGGPDGPVEIYIPVDPMNQNRPGIVHLENPQSWVFLPLAAVWYRLGADDETEADT